MNGTTVSRRTLIQGAGAAAAVSMMPMGAAEIEAAPAAATAAIRDFDMIKAFYANYPKRMKAVRAAIKKIDQATAKGILHKNTAARKKSALARKLNASA